MTSRLEFEKAIRGARSPGERVAVLGALLARESRLGNKLVIVGGSALSVYSAGAYVSKDIDIVGKRARLEPVLRRWGFERKQRGSRAYLVHDDLGILVDVIDREDYVGLGGSTRTETTAFGAVRIAAVEDLIIRRLIFAKRERSADLLNQASLLWARFGAELDTDYLGYHVTFEGVADAYREMRRRAEVLGPLSGRRGSQRASPRAGRV